MGTFFRFNMADDPEIALETNLTSGATSDFQEDHYATTLPAILVRFGFTNGVVLSKLKMG